MKHTTLHTKNHHVQYQAGFTFVETLIIIMLFLTVIGLGTINLLNGQRSTSFNGIMQRTIADIKNQQIRAITGNLYSPSTPAYYSIHFDANDYVLFNGTLYNANDPTNFMYKLEPAFQFSTITFPNGNLTFIPLNGEVYGYSPVSNSITIKDAQSNTQKTLQFNYLGVLTTIN